MTAQIGDLVAKIGKTEATARHRCNMGAMSPLIAAARVNSKRANGAAMGTAAEESSKEETALAKAVKDAFVASPHSSDLSINH